MKSSNVNRNNPDSSPCKEHSFADAPRVSVIVCTYNQEDTIARALDSVLRQLTDFTYEIILADDCSRDGTPAICREYAQRYPDKIRLFLNHRNKGIADNYFDCIEACRGEYIADLAGDDEWCDDHKLAKQVAVMDSDPEIALCHAAWRPVYPDGTEAPSSYWSIPEEVHIKGKGEVTPYLIRHEAGRYFIHLCASLYRRDMVMLLMKKHPVLFRNKNLTCEDLQLKVLLSMVGKIAYIPDMVLNYSVGRPSISSDDNAVKAIRFNSGIIRLNYSIVKELGLGRECIRGWTGEILQYLIMQYFLAQSAEGRDMLLLLIKDEKLPLTLKNRIAIMLSRSELLWKAGLWVRKLLKNLK